LILLLKRGSNTILKAQDDVEAYDFRENFVGFSKKNSWQ
jgi:hypothetical protein